MATYAELQEQIKKLQDEAEKVRAAEIESVLADVKGKIKQYGLTAEQLGFGSAPKKAAKKAEKSEEKKTAKKVEKKKAEAKKAAKKVEKLKKKLEEAKTPEEKKKLEKESFIKC